MYPGAWAKAPLIQRVNKLKKNLPVTLIYGKQDWVLDLDKKGTLAIVDYLSGPTRILLIEKAGHHLYLDNVEGFNLAVTAELNEQKVTAGKDIECFYEHGYESSN